jgi:pimeloyl-ACP methyl ester carboxylesterase
MKPIILLLHGALGAGSQLEPLAALLREHAQVEILTFAGHGGLPLVPEEFSMPHFARQVQDAVARLGGPVHVFGYSMGGYAALLAAQAVPSYFATITTLGTKLDWSPAGAAAETRLLDPATIEAKVPAFAEQLRQRHAPTPWAGVVKATAQLMLELGREPLLTAENMAKIELPVLALVGDADATAGTEASAALAGALPQGHYAVLENTPHPLERVDVDRLAERVLKFGPKGWPGLLS